MHMTGPPQSLRRFRFNRPQRIAAGLLAIFLVQGFWLAGRPSQGAIDTPYALCGSQMWRNPAPDAVDSTSCGRIRDGILAYRLAGLPVALVGLDGSGREMASPANADTPAIRPAGGASPSTVRPGLVGRAAIRLLPRLPFLAAGFLLGGCLWWVTRRLYGNRGGYTALALYCVSPAMLRSCAAPDAGVLAALALYGSVYTWIGVAHAMRPRQRWSPRMLLLAAGLGMAASAHILALSLAVLLGLAAMLWIAAGRGREILPAIFLAVAGALALVFACYGFSPGATGYALRPAAGFARFSLDPARQFFGSPTQAGVTLAAGAALVLYLCVRKSRYFGNTAPLLCALVCVATIPAGDPNGAQLWALPFLLTFVGGVFADAYESRRGRWALAAAAAMAALQAAVCVASLPGLLN